MEVTEYFKDVRKISGRSGIKMAWIKQVTNDPLVTETQSDGRIRKRAKITEGNKFLRVVLLPDGKTVYNAFFDRKFTQR